MKKTKAELQKDYTKLEKSYIRIIKLNAKMGAELLALRKGVDAFESGRMPYCGKTCGECACKFLLNGDPKGRIRCRKQPGMKGVHFDASHAACADWMPHGC